MRHARDIETRLLDSDPPLRHEIIGVGLRERVDRFRVPLVLSAAPAHRKLFLASPVKCFRPISPALETALSDLPGIPIDALFDNSRASPNDEADFDVRQTLHDAAIIIGRDVMSGHEFVLFGRDAVARIAAGEDVPDNEAATICIELDLGGGERRPGTDRRADRASQGTARLRKYHRGLMHYRPAAPGDGVNAARLRGLFRHCNESLLDLLNERDSLLVFNDLVG